MADPRELAKNSQDIVQTISMSAPKEVRCIVFMFNVEGGPVAMSANVPKERIREICRDYLKKSGGDQEQLIKLIGEA